MCRKNVKPGKNKWQRFRPKNWEDRKFCVSNIRHNATETTCRIEKCLNSLYGNYFQHDFHMHSALYAYGNHAGKANYREFYAVSKNLFFWMKAA